jgi:hypothetical protein
MQEIYQRLGSGTPLKWQSAWVTATDYAVNGFVTNDGDAYVCIAAHTSAAGNEPGTGASWQTYWEVLIPGVVSINASAIEHHSSYQAGHSYVVDDLVREAKSGYGYSWWVCISNHTGVAGTTNPTGSSGATYWEEVAGGGQNGESDTDAGCQSFTANTDTPAGATDYVYGYDASAGTSVKKTVDKMFTRKQSINLEAGFWNAIDCGSASDVTLPTTGYKIKALTFVHSDTKKASCKFTLLDAYDGGPIDAIITWYSTGTSNNGVRFTLAGGSIGDGESYDTAVGTAGGVTDNAQGTAYKRLRTATISGITLAGTPAAGEDCIVVLSRTPGHGDDNLDETIGVTGVKLFIGVNKQSEA